MASRSEMEATAHSVQQYYGTTLTSSADLRTDACCDASSVPAALRPLLARIHPEVLSRYYGCGLVVPPLLEGLRVLDLGCGSGRDAYLLAQLVGAHGAVVGVDMTPEQLAVARRHQQHHADQFGFANVTFLEGRIERLEQLPLEPGSFDLVISNCVVNLSADKLAVLSGVRRLLKRGGEFYFGTPEKRFASLGQTQQRTRGCRQAEITVMQQPAIRLSQAGRCS
jgi:SAM-dependent methyltransferase